jgi:ubiquitin-protein ligase
MAASSTQQDPHSTRTLRSQFSKFCVNPGPYLLATINEYDVYVWHFMAVGMDHPFKGGEYIFKLTAPATFPTIPPRLEFCTPNGVFEPGGAICISVGEYHSSDAPGKTGAYGWRPVLGMAGFATQVVNGIMCNDSLTAGIRIVQDSKIQREQYALNSRLFNAKHFPKIVAEFDEYILDNPNIESVQNVMAQRKYIIDKQKPVTPAVQKPVTPAVQKPVTPAVQKPVTPAVQKPVTPAAQKIPASVVKEPVVDSVDEYLDSIC